MIQSLRKKFILVAMCSTFGVLLIIMGTINGMNYIQMNARADELVEMLSRDPGTGGPKMKEMSPEAPFENRYFSVSLNEENEIMTVDTKQIAAVDQETAKTYAQEVADSGKTKGYQGIYRYAVMKTENGTRIFFLDRRQEMNTCRTFAVTSFWISVLGLGAVFLLVVFFSKLVFKPVEETYEKQKRFITDASHELKTPLTIIDANTEVVELEYGENTWTKSIKNQVKRLSSLTQQMVTLTRLDEGDGRLEKAKFNLSDALVDTCQTFEASATVSKYDWKVQIEDGIRMDGDEGKIRQMTGIFLENALKYTKECGKIEIHLEKKGKWAYLRVINDTEPMEPGKKEELFERFYRTDQSRNSKTGGSGIGLSIAKAIVTVHKGKITAESPDGQSLKIEVKLPIC